jgi:hypothetical protein
MKGSCRHCGSVTSNLCSRCDGVWACNYRCLLAVMPAHQVETGCSLNGCDSPPAAFPLGTAKMRQHVVWLLNRFTLQSVTTALKLVLRTEKVSLERNVTVHFVPEATACMNTRRACTDGRDLWVSTMMYEGPEGITRGEIGFPFPSWVMPHVMVILHEFGHLVMGHPYNASMTSDAKELRADCWAARYVEDLKEKL